MIRLTRRDYLNIIRHAKEEYPNEACGILGGIGRRASKVYKMANISENPKTCYFMKPEEQLKVFNKMRLLGIEMLAIYHSHSSSPPYPSKMDCKMAFYPDVDYIIISLKDLNRPEVRNFRISGCNIKEEEIIIT